MIGAQAVVLLLNIISLHSLCPIANRTDTLTVFGTDYVLDQHHCQHVCYSKSPKSELQPISCDVELTVSPELPVVNISSIELSGANRTDLGITWSFSSSSSNQFIVNIVSLANPSRQACSFKDIFISSGDSVDSVAIYDRCVLEVDRESTYSINLTKADHKPVRSYLLFTPGPSGRAIAITLDSKELTLILEQASTETAALRQRVVLIRSQLSEVSLDEREVVQLGKNEKFVKFINTGAQHYTVKIESCQQANDCADSHWKLLQSLAFESQQIFFSPYSMDPAEPLKDVEVSNVTGSSLQRNDLYILIGTVLGGVVLLVVGIVILLLIYRRRRGRRDSLRMRASRQNVFGSDLAFEEDIKNMPPSVLLIYSYDCPDHMVCVQWLSLLLQNTLGCSVMTDFWATEEVMERGIVAWLQHKLATVEYVIVVCSTGARFKASASRRALLEQEMDDSYIIAMNQLHSSSCFCHYKRLVVYFDYSCESDVPPLLDSWPKFRLPRDLKALLEVFSTETKADISSTLLHDNQQLELLERNIQSTKKYIEENPGWLHAYLKTVPDEINVKQKLDVVTVETQKPSSDSESCSSQSSRYVELHQQGVPQSTTPLTLSPEPKRRIKDKGRSLRMSLDSLDASIASIDDLMNDVQFIRAGIRRSKPKDVLLGCMHNSGAPDEAIEVTYLGGADSAVLEGVLRLSPRICRSELRTSAAVASMSSAHVPSS